MAGEIKIWKDPITQEAVGLRGDILMFRLSPSSFQNEWINERYWIKPEGVSLTYKHWSQILDVDGDSFSTEQEVIDYLLEVFEFVPSLSLETFTENIVSGTEKTITSLKPIHYLSVLDPSDGSLYSVTPKLSNNNKTAKITMLFDIPNAKIKVITA